MTETEIRQRLTEVRAALAAVAVDNEASVTIDGLIIHHVDPRFLREEEGRYKTLLNAKLAETAGSSFYFGNTIRMV